MPAHHRPEQFVDAGFGADATRKAAFVNDLLDFIEADYPRDRFTRRLYDVLTVYGRFGLPGHDGPHEFYDQRLSTFELQAQFLDDLAHACHETRRMYRPDLWTDVKSFLASQLPEPRPRPRLSPFTVVGSVTIDVRGADTGLCR